MNKVKVQIPRLFQPLLTKHYRYKLYYGGRAGGKSYAFADCLLLLARSKKLFIACVREIQDSIKDSVYKLLKDRAMNYGFDDFVFYEDRIENSVTGSRFVFKGLKDQNKQNIKSLEGVDLTWCFVAGTKVDGKNIEEIKAGDYVWSYNLDRKVFEYKKVKRIMRKKSPNELIRLTLSGSSGIIGTKNHPIFVKDRGFIPLGEIKKGDVIYAEENRSPRVCVLFRWMWRKNIFRFCGKKSNLQDKGKTLLQRLHKEDKFRENEKKKSYGQSASSRKDEKNNNKKWCKTKDSRWEWKRLFQSSRSIVEKSWSWLVGRVSNSNWTLQRQRWFTHELQDRPCEYILWDSDRSGWWESLRRYCKGRRQKKNSILREQRVESIEVQKQGSLKQLGLCDGGDYVYNIEVEGNNNYFANGILVHNCEEAQSISKGSWEVLDPTIRKPNSEIWISMNREEENDPIWKAVASNPDERTLVVKVNYYDNPFCPEEMKYLAEKCKQDNYDDYEHIWLGAPVAQGNTKLISAKDVRKAIEPKFLKSESPLIIGVDVARFGDDKTVFCYRKGRLVLKIDAHSAMSTVDVANYLMKEIRELQPARIFIDIGANGAGVYDILKDRGMGEVVRGVNFGSKAIYDDRYFNKRAEMWGEANEWLKQELPVQIPNDDELLDDLCSVNKKYDNKGRLQLESKDDVKKRIGRSPDKADAFVLTFAEPVLDNGKVKMYGNYVTFEDLFADAKGSDDDW